MAALKRGLRSVHLNNAIATILPVGFAIDRLEGDGIKINSWFTTPLCAARVGTASTTEATA